MSEKPSAIVIHRRAFNSAGSLGLFYDAYRDQVINQSKPHVQERGLPSSDSLQCEIVKGNKNKDFNILQMIDIEDELILSSISILKKKRSGISAVLNHPHCIDECNRFLYYSWICQEKEFFREKARIQDITGVKNPPMNATHVITRIGFGIDLIVVLQLPLDSVIRQKIDLILEEIRDGLRRDQKGIFELSFDVKELLKRTLNIEFYSNISLLTSSVEMSDIVHQINMIKKNRSRCSPVIYYLESIPALYPGQTRHSVSYTPVPDPLRDRIEQHILHFRNGLKWVEASLEEKIPELFVGSLPCLLKKAHNKLSRVKKTRKKEIQRIFNLILSARQGKTITIRQIDEALLDKEAAAIKTSIDEFTRYVIELQQKGEFISDLRQRKFEYLNVAQTNFNKCHDLKTLGRVLINDDPRNRVLCSSDTLNQSNKLELTELSQNLIEIHKHNSTLRLVYLDFSYSKFPLQKILVIPSLDTDHRQTYPIQQTSLSTDVPEVPPNIPPPSIDETINILLLGESGVGKSTFINAFANYLTFSSLEQAQSNEPIVLIPVSFTMTVGDNFEEHIVKFGEMDSSNNEHFNNVGQSVTQHCKSYVFDLQDNEKKLRIIDTPGFGDTRGLAQDDQNMEHILQYISHLTHLNAICFLLKPNSSRLNIFFRTCLTQLFSFLAPAARENVIFCFTNARSTFYTPGETAPLLKAMLADSSINGISFQKENTFFFDSQWFRYLVALQNDISFTKDDQREYQTSWSTSVKESNRLIDYIDNKLRLYHLKDGWQSIKHAQFEISQIIRPILEAMRNILRNIILDKKNHGNEFIQLQSKPVHHSVTHCLSCKEKPELVGKFWVIPTVQHEIQDDCRLCECLLNQHVRLNYMLEYHCLYNASSHHQNTTKDVLETLCDASSRFAHFLNSTGHSTNGDPFLTGLEQMIDEEKQICDTERSTDFNAYLCQKLMKFRQLYESCIQKINESRSHEESVDLPAIYSSIDEIGKYPMVQEQIVAVKQSQQLMLKDYEHEVETI